MYSIVRGYMVTTTSTTENGISHRQTKRNQPLFTAVYERANEGKRNISATGEAECAEVVAQISKLMLMCTECSATAVASLVTTFNVRGSYLLVSRTDMTVGMFGVYVLYWLYAYEVGSRGSLFPG